MKTKKSKPKPAAVSMLQLCLFDDQQMQAMAEPQPKKSAVTVPVDPDPEWLQWQLAIAEGLTGQAWRQQKAMLTGNKVKTRVKPVVPGHHAVARVLLI